MNIISIIVLKSEYCMLNVCSVVQECTQINITLCKEQTWSTTIFVSLDSIFTFTHLVNKYSIKKGYLYTLFIDLKAAFSSIDRDRLWAKIQHANIDKRLLFYIRSLYSCENGKSILGVQQGVIFACLLILNFISLLLFQSLGFCFQLR